MSDLGKSNDILELIQKMGGYIDENGMLQLKNGFCVGEKIPPHGKFFRDVAVDVEKTYGETGLGEPEDLNGRMIHQFRMYIDRHNLAYIRKNFKKKGMTDEEALAAYVQASRECGGLGGEKMLREPARFHNKYPAGSSYRKYQKGHENKKYRNMKGADRAWRTCADLAVLAVAMCAADFLRTDYGGMGVLTISVMYLFRQKKVICMLAGCIVLTLMSFSEIPAFLTLLPIAFYNGKRGLKMKYFFYAFYPVHLLILWLIAVVMGMGWTATI